MDTFLPLGGKILLVFSKMADLWLNSSYIPYRNPYGIDL